ncbi:unnamed protein product [Chilo suppressalis]|uniref:Uncharacterized protein n=1 Tax=Chilo suppressalis TaxID=168631 RepID=A0ABN8AUU0_CHISP|nr:unnamed protein product [Chilo suppressalis]
MLTRSHAAAKANKSNKSDNSVASSSRSSATVQVRVLEAEAQHLRRIADLERAERERALAAERAVAEAEHRAHNASLEASTGSKGSSRHSSRRSKVVQEWLNRGDGNESTINSIPPQTCMETSHPKVPATVPYLAPEVVTTVGVPLDVTSSAMGREDTTQIRDRHHNPLNPQLQPCTSNTFPTNCNNNFRAPLNAFAPQGGTPFTTAYAPHVGTTSKEIDTLRLAEEVAKIAAATATLPKSGFVSLPFFDGKPTEWLVFVEGDDKSS